jgi:hypothetical protein
MIPRGVIKLVSATKFAATISGSLGLLCRTLDSIFIHCRILAVCWSLG